MQQNTKRMPITAAVQKCAAKNPLANSAAVVRANMSAMLIVVTSNRIFSPPPLPP